MCHCRKHLNIQNIIGAEHLKMIKEDVKKVLSEDIDIIAPSCGLAPKTPLANVKALVEARNEYFNI